MQTSSQFHAATRNSQPQSPPNDQPSREDHVASTHVADNPEKSTTIYSHRISQSRSINITKYAKMLHEDIKDDPEEVESALDPSHDCVNGHRVKIEIDPLLRALFEKYGDITMNCDAKSSSMVPIFLERDCDVFQRLEQTNFFDVMCIKLNDMIEDVRLFDHLKLNVGWLLEKLECISWAKTSLQKYLSVKAEETKYVASLGSLEKKLHVYEGERKVYEEEVKDLYHKISLVEQKIAATKEEMVVKKAKFDHIKKVVHDIKAGVYTLSKQSLVHGLL